MKRYDTPPSECLKTMGYFAKTRTLEVEFMDGHIYQYYGISPQQYLQFTKMIKSYGKMFNRYVRWARIPYKRIK